MGIFSSGKVRAQYAVDKMLSLASESGLNGDFLDVGSGDRAHTKYVEQHGEFARNYSIDSYPHASAPDHILGDFDEYEFNQTFDAVLASHVLEHSLNVGQFLKKLHALLNEGGVFCIIVPPMKSDITAGHVTVWNGGLLLLNCLKAGFDCRDVSVKRQGYNIAIVGRKVSCNAQFGFEPGVPENERAHLPEGLTWYHKRSNNVWYFKGNIRSLNW